MLKHSPWTILILLSLNTALTKGISSTSSSWLDSDLKDFTVDETSNSCNNVEIKFANKDATEISGILHSSYYNTFRDSDESCRWTFDADQDHRIELTFVEYTANCQSVEDIETKLKIKSNKNLWINFTAPENTSALNLSDSQFRSCDFNLGPFTKLETISNSLLIEYDRGSVDFLIFFSVSKDLEATQDCTDKKRCSVEYNLEGSKRTHHSCIASELLCRCAGDCDKLVERYSEFYFKEGTFNDSCQHYAELNDLCERANNLFKPLVKASEDSDDETTSQVSQQSHFARKFVPFNSAQADHMECGNLRFSSEYGWISSANFDMTKSYENGQDCFYFIQLQPNQKVQLRFKYFDLSPNVTSVIDPDVVLLSSGTKRSSIVLNDLPNLKEDAIILTSNMLRNFFKSSSESQSDNEGGAVEMPPNLGITYDYDYLNIYDGPSIDSPLLAHLTSKYNNFNDHFNGYVYNSKSNNLLLRFHTAARPHEDNNKSNKVILETSPPPAHQVHQGFNLTYQIKGFCIEDQKSCNSIYELNCYSPSQVCNDVWDCHNGADERGCGPCKRDQFRCKNHIFCYRLEDRCDGDHQCLDFSDELNCNSWFCNSNNGTFLCDNEQCVYEQWVCDGTNDCRDGSDERNCPTPFTRRVITTAVLGGTLCSLLLVMALGCACKLYTLHTVGYRNNIRLSQTVQSAAAAAAAAPLLTRASSQIPTVAAMPSGHHSSQTPTDTSTVSQTNATDSTAPNSHRSTPTGIINNLSNIFRRNNSSINNPGTERTANASVSSSLSANQSTTESDVANSATNANNGYQFNFNTTTNSTGSDSNNVPPGELPLPHHLIAPPTYNQTMGLVDEYEQRQLAFIEHVRSILAQQQSQNGGTSGSSGLNLINLSSSGQSSFSALTLIPTVTSSSTTVHRVSSSSRRSHSGRHHRHHYHNRPSSNNVDSSQASGAANGANSISDQINTIVSGGAAGSASGSSGSGSSRSHRSHRHHYRHSNHSQARGHNIHHHITNNLTQVNFDANRRGLITQPETTRSNELSGQPAITPAQTSSSTQSQSQPSTSSTDASNSNNSQLAPNTLATTSGQNLTSTLTQMSNKTTSVNLRDKIAKLIKDIVVHHGDNIQYVQLADQLNSSQRTNNASFNGAQSPENSIELTSGARNRVDSNEANTNGTGQSQETFIDSVNQQENDSTNVQATSSSNGTSAMSTSNSNNNPNGSEDDVPLIQP